MASELEKNLRAKPDSFVLKQNLSGKADIWKHFCLLYKKQDAGVDDQTEKVEAIEMVRSGMRAGLLDM